MTVDQEGFKALMQEQRTRARKAREAMGDLGWSGVEFGKDVPETVFLGYDRQSVEDAKVVALVVENEQAEELMPGVEAIVVLDKTPFYAEMGGQVADHGILTAGDMSYAVTDVQKNKGGKYMHYGKVMGGSLKLGDMVTASIDMDRRRAIMRAHSATHLLHKALRSVLGDHVEQAGSLVEPDRVRFDFTHFSAMTSEEITKVEDLVNSAVLEGYGVEIAEMSMDEAKKKGAMALFSEKYGDQVRVVSMGDYSVELCGGTHLDNTAKVGPFRIHSEFSVASGVRRIEAVTGELVIEEMRRGSALIRYISDTMKTNTEGLKDKLQNMMQELRETKKLLEKLQAQQLTMQADQLLFSAKTVKGLKIITAVVPNKSGDELRQMGDLFRDKDPQVVAALASEKDGKISLAAACGGEAVKKGIRAGDLVKHITAITGGSGGGKPERAMGGVKDAMLLDDAFATIDSFVMDKTKE